MIEEIKRPAHKEPWFWIVFAPLILVVFVVAALLSAAFIGADDRVKDDYYKQGRMINNQFEAEQNALAFRVAGEFVFAEDWSTLTLMLRGRSQPENVQIQFSHPSTADRDQTVIAERQAEGRYVAQLNGLTAGRWYVILSAEDPAHLSPWRVSAELNLGQAETVQFAAHR